MGPRSFSVNHLLLNGGFGNPRISQILEVKFHLGRVFMRFSDRRAEYVARTPTVTDPPGQAAPFAPPLVERITGDEGEEGGGGGG